MYAAGGSDGSLTDYAERGGRHCVRKPFKLDRDGLLADVENTILAKQTNLNDLLCKIPGIQQRGNSVEVIGKVSPVYYINGREVMDQTELDNLSVDEIRSVKLIMNPSI